MSRWWRSARARVAWIALAAIGALAAGAAVAGNRTPEADLPRGSPPLIFDRVEVDVGGSPAALVAAEVSGDGRLDLVVAVDERALVLEGDGRGGFDRAGSFPAGESPTGLVAADLDGDGRLDLAAANHETQYVTVLLGVGDGEYRPAPASPLRVDVEPHPHELRSADLDRDGRADLLVDHREGRGVRVLYGRTDGRFQAADEVVDVGGDPYRGFELAALDDDGRLDLAAPIGRAVGIRWGAEKGGFGKSTELDLSSLAPFGVAVGDVNGDGHRDLGVASGQGSDAVAVLLGDGRRGFRPAPGSPYRAGSGAKGITAADLDGDGRDDLAVTSWDATEVTVLLGGDGRLRTVRAESGENPWPVAAGDFDGDGRDDLAVGNYGSGTVTVLLTRPAKGG